MYSFKNLGDNLLNYNSNERINEDQNNDFNPYKKLDNQYNYPSKDKKFIIFAATKPYCMKKFIASIILFMAAILCVNFPALEL